MAELNCRPQQYLRGSVARLAAPTPRGVVLFCIIKEKSSGGCSFERLGDIPCPALLEVFAAVVNKDLVPLADGGDSGSP